MCDECANTLKKNQVKKHFTQCRSKFFSCVDCNQSMTGPQLDAHTVCKSEAEKYFGKFYQGNGDKGKANNGKSQAEGKTDAKNQEKKEKFEEKKGSAKVEEKSGDKEGKLNAGKWRGWKNEIKNVLKEQTDGIEKRKLKKIIVQKFGNCYGDKNNLADIFETKIGFRRFIEQDGKIYYYRFLKN